MPNHLGIFFLFFITITRVLLLPYSEDGSKLQINNILPPTFSSNQSFKPLDVLTTNKGTTIFCNVSTDKNYKIRWFLNGVELNESNHSLKIGNEGGKYWCLVENMKGVAKSQIYNVSSFFLTATECGSQEKVSLAPLEDLTIEKSQIPANPPVKHRWLMDEVCLTDKGSALQEDARTYIDTEGNLHMSYVTLKENKMCIMDVIRNVVFDQRRGCKYIRLSVEGDDVPATRTRVLHKSPSRVVALLGQYVHLECFFNSQLSDNSQVSWRREGSPGHLFNPIYSPYKWRITLEDLKASDEGVYVCSYKGVEAETLLFVQEAPSFPTPSSFPRDTNVTEGDDVTIPCNVSSNPVASIRWLIDDHVINSEYTPRISLSKDHREMVLRGACRDCGHSSGGRVGDSMVVSCEASSPLGELRASGYINVLQRTKVELLAGPAEFTVDTAETEGGVVWKCQVISDPLTLSTPRWKFYLNDQHLGETLMSDGVGMKVDGGVLSLHVFENASKTWDDYAGQYVCSGDNGYSSDEVRVAVNVLHLSRALASLHRNWWLLLLALILIFFLLICLITCCVYSHYNKQISYYVDFHERKNGNDPVKELKQAQFSDYTRQNLAGSKHTLCSVDEDDEDDEEEEEEDENQPKR